MSQIVPSPGVQSTNARWPGILLLLGLIMVLVLIRDNGGPCACEHDPTHGTPLPSQTEASGGAPEAGTVPATPGVVEERSYENTCDGAQAYFDDLWDATDAHVELATPMFPDGIEFYIAYFRSSNPPPIVEEWADASLAFWVAMSDFDADQSHLEAIHAAEEDLEDACEDYPFTENWG